MHTINETMQTRTRRGNRSGTLRVRGNMLWARWTYKGKVFERSTGVSVLAQKAFDKAHKKMDEYTAPYRLAHELDLQTFMSAKLKTLAQAVVDAKVADNGATLGEAYEAFVNSPRRRAIGQGALSQYKTLLSEVAERFGVDTRMKNLTPAAAEDFAASLSARVSNLSFNNYIAKIAHVWDVLGPNNGVKENPWKAISAKPDDSKSRAILSDKEITKVLNAAGNAYDGELRLLILIGKNTGMRISDCVALKWDAVDMTHGMIRVKTIKTGADVSIPLLGDLSTELAARPRKGAYVLPRIHNLGRISNKMSEIFRKAGIETCIAVRKGARRRPVKTFHSLRANFITMCAEAGVPMEIVKSVVGHSTLKMTEHYTHVREKAVKEAFTKAGLS